MKQIRLGWFIPVHRTLKDYNRVLASVWIRCLELIDRLQPMGYHSTINQPWAPMDIAIFLRVQGPWALRLHRFLQWRGVKTIYSAVVNYYEREGNVDKIAHLVSEAQMQGCRMMTKQADAIVAVSRYLQTVAERYNPNVAYLPDTITREHFHFDKPLADFERSPLRLIWSGQGHKAQDIDDVYQAIQDLPVTLTIIANHPPPLKAPFDFVQWRYETFPEEIIKGDICISPRVLDNSYDQGHSNFKIMVFLAQGVPVLAAPQPSYVDVVEDGYNGFICHSAADWRNYLQQLIADRVLLRTMSGNAITSASPYLTENILTRYDALFQKVIAGEPVIQGVVGSRE